MPPEDVSKKGRWTAAEHEKFVTALRMYGKDWYRVGEFVGTRDASQIRSHAQKFSSKLDRDVQKILSVNLRTQTRDDKHRTGYRKHHGSSGSKNLS